MPIYFLERLYGIPGFSLEMATFSHYFSSVIRLWAQSVKKTFHRVQKHPYGCHLNGCHAHSFQHGEGRNFRALLKLGSPKYS